MAPLSDTQIIILYILLNLSTIIRCIPAQIDEQISTISSYELKDGSFEERHIPISVFAFILLLI